MIALVLASLLAQASPLSVSVSVEPKIETLRYRFDNPSSFDTTGLVPHFFEQTYDTDHVWIGGRARYRLFRIPAETSVSFAPPVTAQADDLDTFFQPDGNVIVSGTVGTASLRGVTVSQRVIVGRSERFEYGVGYSYRRDSARYHDGTKITRMTLPPSEVRETVTTREFVTSQIHQARWFATWRPTGGPFSIRAEAAPFAIGRLAVQLPDKYPGRTLVFRSRTSLIGVGAALTHSIGAMELELSARADRSFSYSRKAAMDLNSLSFLLGIGTR